MAALLDESHMFGAWRASYRHTCSQGIWDNYERCDCTVELLCMSSCRSLEVTLISPRNACNAQEEFLTSMTHTLVQQTVRTHTLSLTVKFSLRFQGIASLSTS